VALKWFPITSWSVVTTAWQFTWGFHAEFVVVAWARGTWPMNREIGKRRARITRALVTHFREDALGGLKWVNIRF
jgi:hypothetical protein